MLGRPAVRSRTVRRARHRGCIACPRWERSAQSMLHVSARRFSRQLEVLMTTAPTRSDDAHARPAAAVTADIVSYWLIIAGIYLTVGFLFYYSAKRVLFDQGATMPSGVAAQYKGSFLA